MKKKIVLALSCLLVMNLASQAQTEKNTWLLGGSASFTSSEGNSSFTLMPNVGYFVAENIAVGGKFSLFTMEDYTSWGIGPFARYYFTKNTGGKPFLGAGVNFAGAEGESNVGFTAEAGYAIFLNKSIALELGVNYNRVESMDMINIGAGFQIHLRK